MTHDSLTLLGDGQLFASASLWSDLSISISGALRELSIALYRGNASLGRSGLYNLTRVSGRAPLRGLSCPSAEVV
jgi:hypothetical protein